VDLTDLKKFPVFCDDPDPIEHPQPALFWIIMEVVNVFSFLSKRRVEREILLFWKLGRHADIGRVAVGLDGF
jgi:hypothetical protein